MCVYTFEFYVRSYDPCCDPTIYDLLPPLPILRRILIFHNLASVNFKIIFFFTDFGYGAI